MQICGIILQNKLPNVVITRFLFVGQNKLSQNEDMAKMINVDLKMPNNRAILF